MHALVLRPLQAERDSTPIEVPMDGCVVGRGSGGIMSIRLSREHIRLNPIIEDDGMALEVLCLGTNGLQLLHRGGAAKSLGPGSPPARMRPGDVICLLPGDDYRFSLELDGPWIAGQVHKRAKLGEGAPEAPSSDAQTGTAMPAAGGGSSGARWTGLVLPPYVRPPKPAGFAGMDALARLAQSPDTAGGNIFLTTAELVVAYDVYPKAVVHLLILPREHIQGPSSLTRQHLPLLQKMASLGSHLGQKLCERDKSLVPCRLGFHAVPSMSQLHLHLISSDLRSDCLKNKKHWNSFTTSFFVRPQLWIAQLESEGRVVVDDVAEEAKLKAEMRCPFSGASLKNMPAVKQHVGTPEYRAHCQALADDASPSRV
jgi:aprataxin